MQKEAVVNCENSEGGEERSSRNHTRPCITMVSPMYSPGTKRYNLVITRKMGVGWDGDRFRDVVSETSFEECCPEEPTSDGGLREARRRA